LTCFGAHCKRILKNESIMAKGSLLDLDANTLRMLRRVGWVALASIFLLMVISAIERKEGSTVEEVLIDIQPLPDGNSLLTEEKVRLAIERSFGYHLEGRTLISIDVERLENELEKEAFILDADALVNAQNKVEIQIVPREPILRVMDNNGFNYYLDREGVQMPLSDHFTAKVMVVTGSLPRYEERFLQRKRNRLKEAFLLARYILKDEFLAPMTEQIYFDNRGEITLVPKLGNHTIEFGNFQNARKKLRRLKIFYKEALPYEGWQRYSEVSVAYEGQVIGRR
jgi:cell division protein FtsQ